MGDIHQEGLEHTALLAGKDKVSIHVLNITDRETVPELPEKVKAIHGAVTNPPAPDN